MIERGAEWGAPQRVSAAAHTFTDDRSFASWVRDGGGAEPIWLTGGDLARTLGISGDGASRVSGQSRQSHVVPVDLIRVELDGHTPELAAAHVVIGRWVRDRPVHAVMNAAWIGNRNIGPRAHPGDGLADVVAFDMGARQLWQAMRRSPTGTHVPHPAITVSRRATVELSFERPRRISIDGQTAGSATQVRCTVEQGVALVALP